MNGKDLSRQLGDLPEDMIAEAMAPAKTLHRKQVTARVLRLVAVAAVVAILLTAISFWPSGEEEYVTGSGTFVVRAYGAENDASIPVEGVILEEGVSFTPNVIYDPQISRAPHYPIKFSVDKSLYPGMELTLEVKTNAGIFDRPADIDDLFSDWDALSSIGDDDVTWVVKSFLGQHFTVGIDTALQWLPHGCDYTFALKQVLKGNTDYASAWRDMSYKHSPSFIDVIIRADDHIVGYCVIAIYEINIDERPDRQFSFELLSMVSFPQVHGRFQRVTKEYVNEQIQMIHDSAESGGEN